MCYHKIETSDKRLKALSANDFEYFASVLMNQVFIHNNNKFLSISQLIKWTHDALHLDLDRKFKEDIRECKTYLLSDKIILDTYKSLVLDHIQQHNALSEKTLTNLGYKFHILVKALLHIGAGISKSNEFEDIFEDIEEKLVKICLTIPLTLKEVDFFFKSLFQTFEALLSKLTFQRHKNRFIKTWFRYLEGIRLCTLHIYSVQSPDQQQLQQSHSQQTSSLS
jgi:hypothetical protein